MHPAVKAIAHFTELWAGSENWDQFVWNLNNFRVEKPLGIYVCPLFVVRSEADLPASDRLFKNVTSVETHGGSRLVSMLIDSERFPEEHLRGSATIWPSADGSHYTLVALAPSLVWERSVRIPLERTSPEVLKPSLTQEGMKRILSSFEKQLAVMAIRVLKAASRRWVIAAGEPRRMGSRLDWEVMSVEEAFREAREEGKWFTSIKFELLRTGRQGKNVATGMVSSIHRHGYLQANAPFPELFSSLAVSLVEIGRETLIRLSNRSRLESPNFVVRPLAIEYDADIFKDPSRNKDLIRAATKIPRFGFSVLHGNPYLHISLTDFTDGSSYEIMVVEPRRIFLVPQLRATPASLDRLLSHLFAEFPEGNVVDAAAQQ
jgi:hypothetical protein